MMKQRLFYSIFLAFTAISFVCAQDLDEILDTHFKTIGQEKLLKVNTMEASGKMTLVMMGTEGGFKSFNKKPNKMRVEVEVMGSNVVQAYDGITVWTINPMAGSSAAMEMTGPEAERLIETADMDGQLWNYKEKGHVLELVGTEEHGGSKVFVLKLTKKNGKIDHYYIDSEDYVIVKIKLKVMANGMELDMETLMSDYREVNGYLGAYKIEQRISGQAYSTIQLEEVKYNAPIDDAIFAKPSGEGDVSIF